MKNTIFMVPTDGPIAHQTDAPVIAVKLGETGFYPVFTKLTPAELNERPVSTEVAHSALVASMFGWDCGAAKLARDFLNAEA